MKEFLRPQRRRLVLLTTAAFLLITGMVQIGLHAFSRGFCTECIHPDQLKEAVPQVQVSLEPGSVATMDSPFFSYDPSGDWIVTGGGADPSEPVAPWTTPSGTVEFQYRGRELALRAAVGDYWGYMYVTVDGQPANLLPALSGNLNHRGDRAGYKSFFEPERVPAGRTLPRWIRLHRSDSSADVVHNVRIETWRSWGQVPLRAVAVDALPPEPPPLWPGVLLMVSAGWLLWLHPGRNEWQFGLWGRLRRLTAIKCGRHWLGADLLLATSRPVQHWFAAGLGFLLLTMGIGFDRWYACLLGLFLLALTTFSSLLPWLSVLLFGLPFYFGLKLPLLPDRHFEILDVGLFGGIVLLLLQRMLRTDSTSVVDSHRSAIWLRTMLAALICWALVASAAADYAVLALREWRTVFLAAGLLFLLLDGALQSERDAARVRCILLYAWLAGGTAMAAVGLWHYFSGSMLITAEGVNRVRALYGSPNNLALYLERTLGVSLALGMLSPSDAERWICRAASVVQLAALVLTFSKGALFLGIPVLLGILTIVGCWKFCSLQRKDRGTPRRFLLGIALLALFIFLILSPFLDTARFRQLLDFGQGTSFLRLQLWRSSWQMALDHPVFGVGPDNFLYAYRSDYILPAAWQEPNLNHPHNWLLDWWTRLGVPGLMVGMVFGGCGLAHLIENVRRKQQVALAVGLLAAAGAALAHGLIDASYALPDLMLAWVFIFWVASKGR